jgi:hypothetical protein
MSMSKRTSNKKVKQAICGVYSWIFPCEHFKWVYCSSKESKHFGELVGLRDDSDYPDTIYYGTHISLTSNQLKGE